MGLHIGYHVVSSLRQQRVIRKLYKSATLWFFPPSCSPVLQEVVGT